MLDFLRKVDISQDVIDKMYEVHDTGLLYSLKANGENCLGIIMFLKRMKVNVIDELLIYKTSWFLKTISEFTSYFNCDYHLIDKINNDYMSIEL